MLSSVELLIDFLRRFHSPWASHADGGGVGAIPSGLPDSLELLYRELGHLMLIAPGQDGRRPFGTQDLLCPPNRLDGSDGHWSIAWENSGNWSARCQRDMSDPPVFSDATSRFEGVTPATFEEVCPRVSDFLTTLCLHEAVMSCSSLVNTRSQAGVEALLRDPIEPIWLDGCYVDGPPGRSFFASSDREILVLVREDDVWVGSPFRGVIEALRDANDVVVVAGF